MAIKEWTTYRFRDLGQIVTGTTPSTKVLSYWGGEIPFVTPEDMNGKRYVKQTERTVTAKGAEKRRILPRDSVLVTCIGSVGKMAMSDGLCLTNQQINSIICNPEYDFACIYYALLFAMDRLKHTAGVNVLPIINKSDFGKLKIELPPRKEQQAIACILNAADKVIEQTQEAVEQARDVKKSLVQQLFERGLRGETLRKTVIGPLPKSWRVVPVNSVVTQFQYGLSAEMASKGKYPILRMGNIQAGEILLDGLKYIDLPEKIADTYMLKRGDVLFNRTNSQEHVGKVGIYRNDEKAVFASYLIRLFPDDSQIDRYYLGQLLGSYPAQCRIKRYATPGVQQVNVNAKNIGLVLIPVPTGKNGLQEQRDIAAILEQADERIRAYTPVLDTLADLKRSLMHDLLTGKVRVNHAIDRILPLEAS